MPNIAAVLKEEILRIARKEIKTQLAAVKEENTALRKKVAKLEKQVESGLPAAPAKRGRKPGVRKAVKPANENQLSITGKAVLKLRKKFGLSQGTFAELLGVTGQTVYHWERKKGQLRFRGDASAGLEKACNMTKAQAHAELKSKGIDPSPKPRGRKASK